MADLQITPTLKARRAFRAPAGARAWSDRITPNRVIVAITMLGLALRFYYLSRPGFLFGVTEYDDGSYVGSAIRLVHGQLPYRDFVFVQPPGITLLMVPVALVAKVTGTAWGMALGRILTVLAGSAGVAAAGLLARHRGRAAVLVACGISAVHPESVAAAHTVLVEPWLVLFCLIGALLSFDGDRLASGRRLAWGGLVFGFAGVIESWAIVPVVVLIALSARRPRRAAAFAGAVAAGFLVPTLPFAALAPASFYQSVVVAQAGSRLNATRIYSLYRIRLMTGLSDVLHPANSLVLGATIAIAGVVLASAVVAWLRTSQLPPALDWFCAATGGLIAVAFLWPPQFHYHFVAFLVPFLALSVALATSRLLTALGAPGREAAAGETLRRGACVLAAIGIALAAVMQADYERTQQSSINPAELAAVRRAIPPGACVLADEVSYLVVADRFVSDVPDCPAIDDGTGVNYALSHGLSTATGAGRVHPVAALWHSAFVRAEFVWLSYHAFKRIPWTPPIVSYFHAHFTRVRGLAPGISLYRRRPEARRPEARRPEARRPEARRPEARHGRRGAQPRNESGTVG
jgi:Glycosyltransferase family 87